MSEPIYITANGSHLIVHFDDGGNRYARKIAIDRWQIGAGVAYGKPTLTISNVGTTTARATYVAGVGTVPTAWEVQRATNSAFTVNLVTHTLAPPWNMTGLNDDTTYYVRARAGNGTVWSEWSDTASFTTDETSPTAGFRWPFPPNEIGTEWEGYPGHKGVDWPRAEGTPIIASYDGTVQYAGWTSADGQWGLGNQVLLNHGAIGEGGAVLYTRYAHMVSEPIVSIGQTVTKGQVLGYVGTTGNSTGNHLHWETAVGGQWSQINPRTFMSIYGE